MWQIGIPLVLPLVICVDVAKWYSPGTVPCIIMANWYSLAWYCHMHHQHIIMAKWYSPGILPLHPHTKTFAYLNFVQSFFIIGFLTKHYLNSVFRFQNRVYIKTRATHAPGQMYTNDGTDQQLVIKCI